MRDHGPIDREDWYIGAGYQFQCNEPCCELRRVQSVAVEVKTESELRDALTKPEVFWW